MKNKYVIFIDDQEDIKPGSFIQTVSENSITYTQNVYDAEIFSSKRKAIDVAKKYDTVFNGYVYVLNIIKNISKDK